MRKILLLIVLSTALGGVAAAEMNIYKQGEKNWIDNNHYFTYEFDQRPKIGYDIVKIKMFDKSGIRLTDYSIIATYFMPSMPSMGITQETPFKLNKKEDYLFPIDVVMLGTWQVNMKIVKDKQVIASGIISFDVK